MEPRAGEDVRVENRRGGFLEGRVLAVDSDLLALATPVVPPGWADLPAPARPAPKHTVRIIRQTDIARISPAPAPIAPVPALRAQPPRLDRLARREARALAQRQIVVCAPADTAPAVLALVEALGRTLPCAWHASQPGVLVVMDEVCVMPPYSAEACRGGMRAGSAALLERVRKVISLERARLGLEN